MENLIHLKVITPEKIFFDGKIKQITLPTSLGQITILPKHIPLISLVNEGNISFIREDNIEESFVISGGFVEVTWKKVLLLIDTAEYIDEVKLRKQQQKF